MTRKTIDWGAVELRYRSGTESLRTIAADFGITEGAIRKRAKAEEWTRDLGERVRQATEALLVRKSSTRDVRTERDEIAVAAEMRSNVVLEHRQDIARSRALFRSLLEELEAATDKEGQALIAKLVELTNVPQDGEDERATERRLERQRKLMAQLLDGASRIDSFKRVVETQEKLQRMEREAWSIKDEEAGGNDIDELLKKIGRGEV